MNTMCQSRPVNSALVSMARQPEGNRHDRGVPHATATELDALCLASWVPASGYHG